MTDLQAQVLKQSAEHEQSLQEEVEKSKFQVKGLNDKFANLIDVENQLNIARNQVEDL